jgi:class 3 adenylate cyclase
MGEVPVPELFEETSIYFADIYGFTTLMKDSQPMEIIELLNDYFRAFDAVIENFKVYKASLVSELMKYLLIMNVSVYLAFALKPML